MRERNDELNRPRVFVSYSYAHSRPEAAALKSSLSRHGAHVLQHELEPGASARQQVADLVSVANLIIVLVAMGDETSRWMQYETQLMLQTAWAKPHIQVAVVAPAVGAIPPALRHQRFVTYFPQDEVRFADWSDQRVADEFAERVLGITNKKTAPLQPMSDEEVRAWRNRLVHVVGPPEITPEEAEELRHQLSLYLEDLQLRLSQDERFDPDAGSRILDRVSLAQAVGDTHLASAFYEIARTVFARTFPPGSADAADAEYRFGLIAWQAGDLATAKQLFTDSVDHDRSTLGSDHPATIAALYNLARVQAASHDPAAASTYQEALDNARMVLGDRHPQTAAIAYNFGILRAEEGPLSEARALLSLAVEAYRQARPDDSPELQAAIAYLTVLDSPVS